MGHSSWCHYGAVGSWKRRLSDAERSVLLAEHTETIREFPELTLAHAGTSARDRAPGHITRVRAAVGTHPCEL